MEKAMQAEMVVELQRAEHSFRLADAVYLFRNEAVSDYAKRSILRMFFIQIDNLLAIIPRIKNGLPSKSRNDQAARAVIEQGVLTLRRSYEEAFDLIRDRLAAHGQPIDLITLVAWWNSFDYDVVEVLHGDLKEIQSSLEAVGITFMAIPDYSPLSIPEASKLSKLTPPMIAADRLAFSRPNTTYLVPCHVTQEKAQIVLSIIDFLEVDFALTIIVNGPRTIYLTFLFEIAWMLAIIDLCSLIDNLFVSSSRDKSLLEYWEGDMKGHALLSALNSSRNHLFEQTLRGVRNRYSAHLDSASSLDDSRKLFEDIDLRMVNDYAHHLVVGFRKSCGQDPLTRIFLIQNVPLSGVLEVRNEGSSFGG